MKRVHLLSLSSLALLITTLDAAPISLDEAKNTAINWMLEKSGEELTVDDSALGATSNTSDAYRIIKLKPKGWVIVSSDDVAKPIIGYGTSALGVGSNLAFEDWMKGVEEQINSAKNSLGATSTQEQEEANTILATWGKYKIATEEFKNNQALSATAEDDFNYVVRPLLWLNSNADTEDQGIRWNQNPFENQACPSDPNGQNGHVYVGCVATVMGQLMRYYQYPAKGIGSHSYTHPTYGEQSVDFSAANYDWANMPLKLTQDNAAVAEVLYHAGVAVDMDYGTDGSAAWLGQNDAMRQFFGYQINSEFIRRNYANPEWRDLLHNQLNQSHPIAYSGSGTGGHLFIIDGYDADEFYHLNWGWGGYANGKFTIDNLTPAGDNYTLNHRASIIIPEDTSPTVTISDANLRTCVMDTLGVASASDIRETSVGYLDELLCENKGIVDITALEYFNNLSNLNLDYNNLTDISVLGLLTHLTELRIGHNQITNINALATLTNLNGLSIKYNNITDITSLQNLTSLSWMLDIASNNISDISVLNNLTSIQWLNISYNKISDISSFQNLNALTKVYLYGNYIYDFSNTDSNVINGEDSQYTLLAPTALNFTDVSQSSVTLHWTDNSDNETGFKIYRDGILIATVASDVTSYTDAGLAQSISYQYTVKATLE